MRLKKAGAALTALVCSAMMLTSMPLQSSVVSADVIENDFEITYDGWCGTTVQRRPSGMDTFQSSRCAPTYCAVVPKNRAMASAVRLRPRPVVSISMPKV